MSPRTNSPTNVVQPTNPSRHPNWDAQVKGHPNFSFFHSAAWARVLENTYGYSPAYFTTSAGNELQSLLPVMEVDSWLTGRRGIALPFTDECEPFCPDVDAFKKLFQGAVEFGKSRGWKYLESRGGRKFFDGAAASLSFYGHSLDLAFSEEILFARLEGSARRAIRKAEKDGVTVEISQGLEVIKTFYSLQCKTRKKHGLPPQPFSFFLNIHKHILSHNLGIVALASWQKTPIAASVYFHLGDRAIYKYGASDEAFQHLRGSNLVMWEAIKWHANNGSKTMHLGRTSVANEGLRRFKLGWGAQERIIEYVKYDLRNDRFVTDADESSGWHNRLFRALPINASRIIGAALYRHWA
jgi:hypothetical protein